MLRGNPPPPHPPFFSFYLFSFTFQKKSENFRGGGVEPPELPPLKYALVHVHIHKLQIQTNTNHNSLSLAYPSKEHSQLTHKHNTQIYSNTIT